MLIAIIPECALVPDLQPVPVYAGSEFRKPEPLKLCVIPADPNRVHKTNEYLELA